MVCVTARSDPEWTLIRLRAGWSDRRAVNDRKSAVRFTAQDKAKRLCGLQLILKDSLDGTQGNVPQSKARAVNYYLTVITSRHGFPLTHFVAAGYQLSKTGENKTRNPGRGR